jgi:hypothetical protein
MKGKKIIKIFAFCMKTVSNSEDCSKSIKISVLERISPWMKEEKGIRHRGEGAYLRCPVSNSVQFSLRNVGSSEYICVCEGRESLRPNF